MGSDSLGLFRGGPARAGERLPRRRTQRRRQRCSCPPPEPAGLGFAATLDCGPRRAAVPVPRRVRTQGELGVRQSNPARSTVLIQAPLAENYSAQYSGPSARYGLPGWDTDPGSADPAESAALTTRWPNLGKRTYGARVRARCLRLLRPDHDGSGVRRHQRSCTAPSTRWPRDTGGRPVDHLARRSGARARVGRNAGGAGPCRRIPRGATAWSSRPSIRLKGYRPALGQLHRPRARGRSPYRLNLIISGNDTASEMGGSPPSLVTDERRHLDAYPNHHQTFRRTRTAYRGSWPSRTSSGLCSPSAWSHSRRMVMAAIVWAVGHHSANPSLAGRGKAGVLVALAASILVGGANGPGGFLRPYREHAVMYRSAYVRRTKRIAVAAAIAGIVLGSVVGYQGFRIRTPIASPTAFTGSPLPARRLGPANHRQPEAPTARRG